MGLADIFMDTASEKNAEANYDKAVADYAIRAAYREDLLVFADHELAFAAERQAYSNATYSLAVASRNNEMAFREREVANKKLAATTEYKAQGHVASILMHGAEEQAKAVVNDALRVAGSNKRETVVAANKMMGVNQAKRRSGLAQGRSKDRIIADDYIQRNKALGQINSKAKASIIQTIQAKDKIANDQALKLGEAYRGLQAVMRLEAAPVAYVPPATPVFDYVRPVAPLDSAPVEQETPGFFEQVINFGASLIPMPSFGGDGGGYQSSTPGQYGPAQSDGSW